EARLFRARHLLPAGADLGSGLPRRRRERLLGLGLVDLALARLPVAQPAVVEGHGHAQHHLVAHARRGRDLGRGDERRPDDAHRRRRRRGGRRRRARPPRAGGGAGGGPPATTSARRSSGAAPSPGAAANVGSPPASSGPSTPASTPSASRARARPTSACASCASLVASSSAARASSIWLPTPPVRRTRANSRWARAVSRARWLTSTMRCSASTVR